MDFPIKLMIPIFVVAIISIACISTHIFDTTNSSFRISGNTKDQTPYVIETTPKQPTPIPTPTPLYYEEFKYPTEPCSQSAVNFETHCMGRTRDKGYCEYWEYQYRKNCKFIRW